MGKANRAEMEARILEVADLLATNTPRRQVIAHCREVFGVQTRQAETLLARAYEMLAEHREQDREQQRAKHLATLQDLYAKAMAKGHYRTAVAILDQQAKMGGLYEPDRLVFEGQAAVDVSGWSDEQLKAAAGGL